MGKKYLVTLTDLERESLYSLIATGKALARKLTHARIRLKADSSEGGPNWKDETIRKALDVSLSTIARVRERFVEEGLEAALSRQAPLNPRPRRLDGAGEARLIAIACSAPPPGHARWTLRLLADPMVELDYVPQVSYQTLKKTNFSRT